MSNVQTAIDYTTLNPLPYKKTLAYINNFIINTTQFLNRFSYLCEKKLCDVSKNIQRLEITMAILEAKLNSIPDLEALGSSTTTTTASDSQTLSTSTDGAAGSKQPPVEEYTDHTALEDGEGTPPPAAGGMTVQDDPRYATYFKMLRLRVPVYGIKQKMMIEGVNPDILDNPNAPSDWSGPPQGGEGAAGSGSESEGD